MCEIFFILILFYCICLQIKLKFTRGDSYRSDIAVDDVSFSDECYNIQSMSDFCFRPLFKLLKSYIQFPA